ncbi:MAG: DNA-3-methyladenine glycosylase I [Candidatus Azotimanducaceae bacterium WSBS_2022_MAG_OTU7]
MVKEIKKCGWCVGNELYEKYHDDEWGTPNYDDQQLFEFLILEGAQAGLSWITILNKRAGYQKAFDGFDAEKMARYRPARINKLLQNPEIVRNRLKVESAVTNARLFLDVKERTGSFSDYVWQFVDHQPRQNRFRSKKQVPATTQASDRMAATMKKDGFRFVGSTICYAYMQATGMVNDHLVSCFRHEECLRLSK